MASAVMMATLRHCRTLRESVFAGYVLPEHYFYSLDPEAEGEAASAWELQAIALMCEGCYQQGSPLSSAAADIDKPTGVLIAKVIEAKHVPKMDLLSLSSPYLT